MIPWSSTGSFTLCGLRSPVNGDNFPARVFAFCHYKCLWPIVGFVKPTQVSFAAQWMMLVDDPFTLDTTLPSTDVISN